MTHNPYDEFSQERLAEIGRNALDEFLSHPKSHSIPVTAVDFCNALGLTYEEAARAGYIKPQALIYEIRVIENDSDRSSIKAYWTPDRRKALHMTVDGPPNQSFKHSGEKPWSLKLYRYGKTNFKKLAAHQIECSDSWANLHGGLNTLPELSRQNISRNERSEFGKLQTFYLGLVGGLDVPLETSFYVAPKERSSEEKAGEFYYYPKLNQALKVFQYNLRDRLENSNDDVPVWELGVVFAQSGRCAQQDIKLALPLIYDDEMEPGKLHFKADIPGRNDLTGAGGFGFLPMTLDKIFKAVSREIPDIFDQDLLIDDLRVRFVPPGEPLAPDLGIEMTAYNLQVVFSQIKDGAEVFLSNRNQDYINRICQNPYVVPCISDSDPIVCLKEHQNFLLRQWMNYQVSEFERNQETLSPDLNSRIADAAARLGQGHCVHRDIKYELEL